MLLTSSREPLLVKIELRTGKVGVAGVLGAELTFAELARASRPGWDHGRPPGIEHPMLAEAQIVGGVIQGIGGETFEAIAYDGDGQLLSGSLWTT